MLIIMFITTLITIAYHAMPSVGLLATSDGRVTTSDEVYGALQGCLRRVL